MSDNHRRTTAAAIDIGTNSIKMTVAHVGDGLGLEQIDWATEPVRLGLGLDRTGRLDEERIEAAIATLHRFAARARDLGAVQIVAVATEATRAAENGAGFLDRIRGETGIEVRSIDGQEEAALTFRGLAQTSNLSGSVVVADIGGGSTELIVAQDGVIAGAESLVLGSGRLTDRFVASDPPTIDEIVAAQEEASAVLAGLGPSLPLPIGEGARLMILGGTGEYLERLIGAERGIDLSTVREALARMMKVPAAELAVELDVPEARARVLPAGAAIVAALIERLQPERTEIARSGIRAGLLLDLVEGDDRKKPDATAQAPANDVKPDGGPDSAASADGAKAVTGESYRETMRALIGERWEVVWETIPAAIEGSDIEAVHDVRVASRRLRAAMDVGAECFAPKRYKPLHRAAKEITGALGEVRDRDVLLEALRADREHAPLVEHPGIDRLIDRVERERVVARASMEAYLVGVMEGPLRAETGKRFGPRGENGSGRHHGEQGGS